MNDLRVTRLYVAVLVLFSASFLFYSNVVHAKEGGPGAATSSVRATYQLEMHDGASNDALPDDIRRALATDEEVLRCFDEKQQILEVQRDWFVVYREDLNGDGARDWIVKGKAGCVLGANVGSWWVYQETPKGRRLLLKTSALALDINHSSRRGFADLTTHRVTGRGQDLQQRFRYTGQSYAPLKRRR